MSNDPNADFDQALLDKIEMSPIGALPVTPAYQDALERLHRAQQVYPSADFKDGHVTARSLASLPCFYAGNLDDFIAGAISDDMLEANASIYDRYVASLPEGLRAAAEGYRVMVIGKAIHHRTKAGQETVHDPLHTLVLVPGSGVHPGLPGNYLHGSLFHVGDEAAGNWVIHVHDREDGACQFATPKLPDALAMLQDVLESAPFHLTELEALGFAPA